eukprot:Gregarina_sp_Poly_1__10804@NODE_831_length_6095_cov_272_214167_g601_i0_p6_GENE_NODE_831_length_6095_cov_272_214167_g601_i0NODE_831_length_6095_cov_272_214167_g601_i0_p6_ORF_typecomplete_len184_score14_02_NODE_831_length_6095_cov_272_214167_g601_i054746025
MLRTILLPLLAEASLELLYRLNGIPVDLLTAVFGTHNNPLGGIVFPLDSRLMALFSRVPFLTAKHLPPQSNPRCHALWAEQPHWLARAAMKRENTTQPDDPFVAIVEHPTELVAFSAEDLTCLYHLGYAPNAIVSGPAYGRVLYVLGRPFIRELTKVFWGGKIFLQAPCDDSKRLVSRSSRFV